MKTAVQYPQYHHRRAVAGVLPRAFAGQERRLRHGVRIGAHLPAGVVPDPGGRRRPVRGDRPDSDRRRDVVLGGRRGAGARNDRSRGPRRVGVLLAGGRSLARAAVRRSDCRGLGRRRVSGRIRVANLAVLGQPPPKHETRTDWRRRPLSKRQVEYAVNDVRFLQPLRDAIHARLDEMGRLGWLADEMESWRKGDPPLRSRKSVGGGFRATPGWTRERWPSSASCSIGATRRPDAAISPLGECFATT